MARAGVTFTCQIVAADGRHDQVVPLEYRTGYVRVVAVNGKPVRAARRATTHG